MAPYLIDEEPMGVRVSVRGYDRAYKTEVRYERVYKMEKLESAKRRSNNVPQQKKGQNYLNLKQRRK